MMELVVLGLVPGTNIQISFDLWWRSVAIMICGCLMGWLALKTAKSPTMTATVTPKRTANRGSHKTRPSRRPIRNFRRLDLALGKLWLRLPIGAVMRLAGKYLVRRHQPRHPNTLVAS